MAKIQIKNSFITSSAQITISSSLVRFSDNIRAKSITGSFNASSTGTNIFVQGGNSFGTTALIGTNDSSALAFETNGSTRATIDTNGNLGIGSTSPACKLDVAGTIRSSTSEIYGFGASDNVSIRAASSVNVMGIYTSGAEKIRIAADGNVGIGTSNPTSKLQVYGGNASTNTFALKVGDNTNTLNYIPSVSAGSYNFASSNGGSALFNNLASDWWVGVHDGAAVRFANKNLAIYNGANNINLYVSSSGNVGIGTNVPTGLLEVYASNNGGLGGYLILNNNGNAIANETAIIFGDGNIFGRRAAISSTTEDSPYYGDLKFKTGLSAYSSLTTRMIIKGNGNVGIGTTSPSSAVSFNKVVEAYDATSLSYQVNSGGTYKAEFGISSNGGWLGTSTAHDMRFASNGAERMRITSGGNVGIGTTVSAEKLSVEGSVILAGSDGTSLGSGRKLRFYRASDGWEPAQIEQIWTGASYQGVLAFKTNTGALGTLTTKMVINNDGNVGIGTTSPTANLHVSGTFQVGNGTNFGNKFTLYESFASGKIGFCMRDTNGDDIYSVYCNSTSGEVRLIADDDNNTAFMTFQMNGSERMRITNAGNVGIGTTSPGTKLEVVGSIRGGSFPVLVTNTGEAWFGRGSDRTLGSYTLQFGGTSATSTYFEIIDRAWTKVIFAVSGEAPDNTFKINTSGNVGIGSGSPAAKLHVEGNDIRLNTEGSYAEKSLYFRYSNNAKIMSDSYLTFLTSGTPAERMRIASDGNVGIGTTTVRSILHVNGDIIRDTNVPYSWSTSAPFRTFAGAYSYANGGVNGVARYLLLWPQITNVNGQNGRFVNARLVVSRGATHAYNDTTIGDVVASAGYNSSANLYSYTPIIGEKLYFYNIVYNSVTYLAISLPISDYRWELTGHYGIEETAYYSPTFVYANTSGVGTITQLTDYTNESLSIYNKTNNIGIGTTNPTAKLHVVQNNSGGVPAIRLSEDESTIQGPSANTQIRMGSNLVLNASSTMLFGTNGSERIRVISDGNVGIGTSSPNYPIDLQSTTSPLTLNLKLNKSSVTNDYAELAFQLWSGAGSGANTFGGAGTSRPSVVLRALNENGTSAAGAFVVGTFEGGSTNVTLTEKFRIASTGNVGIGTTSVTNKLMVETGASDSVGIRVIDSGNGVFMDVGRRGIRSYGSNFYINVGDLNGIGNIDIQQNSSTRIFIKGGTASDAGYVGIGSTSPTAKLDVVGNVRATSFTGSFSGLPNGYLYARRITSNQTISSGNWANIDLIFNGNVVSSSIKYNSTTGVASLTGGKVYRITSGLSWTNNAAYAVYWSLYKNSNNAMIGPEVSSPSVTYTINVNSPGILEMIYAPTASIDVKIRTTANSSVYGTSLSLSTDNSYIIIQQLA